MLPLFLKGYDPIFISLGVVSTLTGVISFMVGGCNRKGLVTYRGHGEASTEILLENNN